MTPVPCSSVLCSALALPNAPTPDFGINFWRSVLASEAGPNARSCNTMQVREERTHKDKRTSCPLRTQHTLHTLHTQRTPGHPRAEQNGHFSCRPACCSARSWSPSDRPPLTCRESACHTPSPQSLHTESCFLTRPSLPLALPLPPIYCTGQHSPRLAKLVQAGSHTEVCQTTHSCVASSSSSTSSSIPPAAKPQRLLHRTSPPLFGSYRPLRRERPSPRKTSIAYHITFAFFFAVHTNLSQSFGDQFSHFRAFCPSVRQGHRPAAFTSSCSRSALPRSHLHQPQQASTCQTRQHNT